MSREDAVEPRLRSGDMEEIFAWLDYGIAKGFNAEWYKRTIVGHLSHTRQKDFTWKQIDQRFHSLWRFHGDLSDHTHIYSVGTKASRFYKHNDAATARIRTRVKQLLKEHTNESLRPSRVRRGIKRAPHSIRAEAPTSSSRSKKFRTKKKRFKQDSIIRQGSNSRNSDENSTVRHSAVSLEAPLTPGNLPKHITSGAISDNESSASMSSASVPSVNNVVENLLASDESYQNINPNALSIATESSMQQSSIRPLTRRSMLSTENNLPCNLTACKMTRQVLADHEREVQYLRFEFCKAQDTIRTLRSELQCEKHAHVISVKDGEIPSKETLKSYLKEIEILRARLDDKEALSQFTTRLRKKHIPFDEKYFQKNMNNMRYVIEEFMSYTDTLSTCDNLKLKNQPEDLRCLLQRVLGESGGTLNSLSFHFLLRSLLSAAVCEWVLECDLQEHCLASTLWREAALSHLATLDGDDVARNLDFATYHSLIQDDYFQKCVIPTRAKALANRICTAITPLLHPQNLALPEVGILKELDKHLPTLTDMFESALRIKSRALVSKDIFDVVLPRQGSAYDESLMEDEQRYSGGSLQRRTPLVRLCLTPGLRKYEFERKLVDYNSFRKPGADPGKASEMIAKAVVLI